MRTISTLLHDDGPDASDQVRRRTSEKVNRKIDRQRRVHIVDAIAGGREAIAERLAELDHEWNIDRALMLTFATVSAFFHELERHVDRRFGWILRVQTAFLAVYAVTGWCPPQPVLRRLGMRTQQEIDAERSALLRALETLELEFEMTSSPLY
jgi:hypothetical protein